MAHPGQLMARLLSTWCEKGVCVSGAVAATAGGAKREEQRQQQRCPASPLTYPMPARSPRCSHLPQTCIEAPVKRLLVRELGLYHTTAAHCPGPQRLIQPATPLRGSPSELSARMKVLVAEGMHISQARMPVQVPAGPSTQPAACCCVPCSCTPTAGLRRPDPSAQRAVIAHALSPLLVARRAAAPCGAAGAPACGGGLAQRHPATPFLPCLRSVPGELFPGLPSCFPRKLVELESRRWLLPALLPPSMSFDHPLVPLPRRCRPR